MNISAGTASHWFQRPIIGRAKKIDVGVYLLDRYN